MPAIPTLPPGLPHLPTLHLRPSWLNAAGRIDRSACATVRVREVRGLAGCRVWKHVIVYRPRKPGRLGRHQGSPSPRRERSWRRVATRPLPFERRARTFAGREATGIFHLNLAHVEQLLGPRLPQQISGDFRTEKANALRGSWTLPLPDKSGVPRIATRFKGLPRSARGPAAEEPRDKQGRRLVAANPNAGATREKLLTLDRRWQQPLRLERWRQESAILPFLYLICPGPMPWWSLSNLPGGHAVIARPDAVPGVVRDGSITTEQWRGESDCRCPKPSTRETGRGKREEGRGTASRGRGTREEGGGGIAGKGRGKRDEGGGGSDQVSDISRRAELGSPSYPLPSPLNPLPSPLNPLPCRPSPCPQRVYFLMLPLATADELADALTAQAWILGLDPQSRTTHANLIHQLLTRYGLLFEPRCFVCAKCLGVRYGEDPEKVRLRVQKHRAKWKTLAKPKPPKKGEAHLAC